MSSAFRGQVGWAANRHAGRTPVAYVSRGALLHNARSSGATTYSPRLLAADAWGHGAETVAAVLAEAGLTALDSPPATDGAVALPDRSTPLDPSTLYGLETASTPAMRFVGTVLAAKDLRAGEGVSYGYRYRAPADTRIALVTGGYAQGVVRSLGDNADVTFAGVRHRIVGRVAMDVCVVEIADAAIHRGDEAVFFGDPSRDEPSIAQWHRATGLAAPELVAAVGLHAHREVTA